MRLHSHVSFWLTVAGFAVFIHEATGLDNRPTRSKLVRREEEGDASSLQLDHTDDAALFAELSVVDGPSTDLGVNDLGVKLPMEA